MTYPEFYTAGDERERTQEYLFNLGRLDDIIQWKRSSIIDGADCILEQLKTLGLSDMESYDIETQHYLDQAIALQIEKIVAFTTEEAEDLNRFIHEHPRRFRITHVDTQESEVLLGLAIIGQGEEIRIAAQTDSGEIDISICGYVLRVQS